MNLQVDFVRVVSSFVWPITSILTKIGPENQTEGQDPQLQMDRLFWRAVSVCFPAKCHQYHDHVAVIPTILTLLKSHLVQAAKIRLVWLKANFINGYSSLVPKLSFHAWSIKLDSGKACM